MVLKISLMALMMTIWLAPAHASQLTLGLGVGHPVGNSSFSSSNYLNIWVGSRHQRRGGWTSGMYASGNVGASYWRTPSYVQQDAFGRPINYDGRYRSDFWSFSVGPTFAVNQHITLFTGAGMAHRNRRPGKDGETKLNLNTGVQYHVSRQGSVLLGFDSANQGIALTVGYRVF